eukprot:11529593-Heterocapsa_arctica.AAC.1
MAPPPAAAPRVLVVVPDILGLQEARGALKNAVPDQSTRNAAMLAAPAIERHDTPDAFSPM